MYPPGLRDQLEQGQECDREDDKEETEAQVSRVRPDCYQVCAGWLVL